MQNTQKSTKTQKPKPREEEIPTLEELKSPLMWCYFNLNTAQRIGADRKLVTDLVASVMNELNAILFKLYKTDEAFQRHWQR